jgi:prepilin-type N-terminal cleavage/methylation domain-containing protein
MSIAKIARRDPSGFSLTELVVVMAAGLIVITAAIPLTTTVTDGYRLALAAQSVSAQLHYARMKAVASNEELWVNFPASPSGTYRVETTAGTVLSGPFWLPNGITWNAACGSGVTFPGRYVAFASTGDLPASGNGSAGRVKITNQAGRTIDVVVYRGGIIRQTTAYSGCTPPF